MNAGTRQKILDAIITFIDENGRSPYINELKKMGLPSVEYYLNCLAREGAIRRTKWGRQFEVVRRQSNFVSKRFQSKKLDGRRINNQRAADRRTQAQNHGRGAEFVIHGKIKSKRDPDLQKRIDDVVKAAQEREKDHNTDVVNEYRNSRFRATGLKCTRIG